MIQNTAEPITTEGLSTFRKTKTRLQDQQQKPISYLVH